METGKGRPPMMADPSEKWIELIRFGAYGDLVAASCVFPGLKAQGYRIRFVCSTVYAPVLDGHPYVDELVAVKDVSFEAAREATADRPKADKTCVLSYPGSDFFNYHPLGFPDHPIEMHITTYFCHLARVPPTDELTLWLPEEEDEWGRQFEGMVLLQTTSSFSPYKNWPQDRWQALAKLIESELNLPVRQVGSKSDPRIEGVEMIQSPSMRHALAAVKHCRLFVGPDSAFNHASRAFRKPALILWGSTNPVAFGYRQHVNLVNSVVWTPVMGNAGPLLRCQPCYKEYKHMQDAVKPTCPHTIPYRNHVLPKELHPRPELHACMATNTVPSVFFHVANLVRLR